MEMSLSEGPSPLTVPNLSHDDHHSRYLSHGQPHINAQGFPVVVPPPPPLIQLSSPLLGRAAGQHSALIMAGETVIATTTTVGNKHLQATATPAINTNGTTTTTTSTTSAANATNTNNTNTTTTTTVVNNNSSNTLLPSVDSIIQASIHKKPLKDLTTAESILLLDLVCHPNRIPLGTIKYRITGEILNHVKTPQDLAEIGLQFPRIILCSMAEAIVKYQREGVPLEIFPATCSLSSKVALADFSTLVANTNVNGNSNSPASVTEAATPLLPIESSVVTNKAVTDSSVVSSVETNSNASTNSPESESQSKSKDNQQIQDQIKVSGGGKRVARGNSQDKPSPSPVIAAVPNNTSKQQPIPKSVAEPSDTSNAAPSLAPLAAAAPKNVLYLHSMLSPKELDVISTIEQKLFRDGYDIQTRFLPGSNAASLMNEWMENQKAENGCNQLFGGATFALQSKQSALNGKSAPATGKNANGKPNGGKMKDDKVATVSSVESNSKVNAMSVVEYMTYLLTLYCPTAVTKKGSRSIGGSTSSDTTTMVDIDSTKPLLTTKILLFILSLCKTILEHCPMQFQNDPATNIQSRLLPIRRQDIDQIYDLLKLALQIGGNKECLSLLSGGECNNKLELIFDPIIDMATSHHKSFVPSMTPSDATFVVTTTTSEGNSGCSCDGSQTVVSEGEQSTELIGTTKICDVLIQMCKDFYSQVDLCVITCCAINDVTMQRQGFFTEYQDMFYDSGIASILIRSLFLHKANGTAIQSICCAIIGLIANHPKNSRQFREQGTFEVLVQVLRLHLVDVNVVERILDAMLRVAMVPKITSACDDTTKQSSTLDSPTHAQQIQALASLAVKPIRFKETGACELIVEVLSLHKTNASVAVTASRIIGIMALTMEHAIKLGQVGAIEELLEVLKIYISRESIEKYAANALRNLLCFEQNKMKIHKIGACELILKIVLLHLNAVSVVEKLIGILLHLSSWTTTFASTAATVAGNNPTVATTGTDSASSQAPTSGNNTASSTAVGSSINNNNNNGQPAATAVTTTTTNNNANSLLSQKLYQQHLMKLGENGICLILVELLKEHKAESSIVRQACQTLKHVASIAENQRRLVDHNLFSVLVDVLSIHERDATIVSRTCDVLNCIAIIPKATTGNVATVAAGTTTTGGNAVSRYVPEKREVFIRHVPTRFVHLLAHIAPPNTVPPPLNSHHHHNANNNSVGSGSAPAGVQSTPPPPRVITNRHYFCNTISLKKNQTMLPFTEVAGIGSVGNSSDVLRNSNILTYLQDCLIVHQDNEKLEKKIRQTLMLMSCLA